jgi:hypothetical protein
MRTSINCPQAIAVPPQPQGGVPPASGRLVNTRRIGVIVIGGRYVARSERDRRMAGLAASAQ